MRKIFQRTASNNQLSIPQYVLLMKIAPRKEVTQKQIGRETGFPKSTLSQAVDGLVQSNLLHRHPVEDNRREMQLTLSEEGQKLYEKISSETGSVHQVLGSAINTLTVQQQEALHSAFLQMEKFLEKEILEQGE
ncbi:hypothetical protein J6TS2_35730 [Heyndrickxia sporothermodurans]|nr:hypothetical protein J6TS2_35730 [Heyndrickxia sporothermodurans]